MPLEDLLETIETLRARIDEHTTSLQQDETRTRNALIDPLLAGLGWDTGDPGQVISEYRSENGKADYALLGHGGRPAIIVEAKRLGTPLREAVSQVINYCTQDGFDYFAVTDGQHWELYETHRRGNLAEKMVTSLDLAGSPAEMCLRALALWRPGVAEGNIQEGETPVVGSDLLPAPATAEPAIGWLCPECEEAFDTDDTRRIARHKQQHTLQRQPDPDPMTPPPEGGRPWIRLSELHVEAHTKPAWLLPPSGVQVSTPSWTVFVARLAQWLVDIGRLSGTTAPIQVGKRYVLAQEPIHPDGKAFRRVQRAGPLYIETNYSGADTMRNAALILKRAEMQPRDFMVRLAE